MVDFLQVIHFDISPIYFSLSSKQNACCFVNRIYHLDSGYVTKKVGHWLPFFSWSLRLGNIRGSCFCISEIIALETGRIPS